MNSKDGTHGADFSSAPGQSADEPLTETLNEKADADRVAASTSEPQTQTQTSDVQAAAGDGGAVDHGNDASKAPVAKPDDAALALFEEANVTMVDVSLKDSAVLGSAEVAHKRAMEVASTFGETVATPYHDGDKIGWAIAAAPERKPAATRQHDRTPPDDTVVKEGAEAAPAPGTKTPVDPRPASRHAPEATRDKIDGLRKVAINQHVYLAQVEEWVHKDGLTLEQALDAVGSKLDNLGKDATKYERVAWQNICDMLGAAIAED